MIDRKVQELKALSTAHDSQRNPQNFSRLGLFDSGVGGLSVLRQLEMLDGKRDFVYLADTARCPYGNREQAEIERFVEQIIRFLLLRDVDALVMACNTSSALALDVARRVAPVPIYDLITPTAKHVANLGKRVGVIATAQTARKGAFGKAIRAINPNCQVYELGCPDLVPIVEAGNVNLPSTLAVLENHVLKLLEQKVELLILGCTHFPFLSHQLESLIQGKMQLIDPAKLLLSELSGKNATNAGLALKNVQNSHVYQFFVTGCANSFSDIATSCLGYRPESVTNISVEALGEYCPLEKSADLVMGAQVTSPVVS